MTPRKETRGPVADYVRDSKRLSRVASAAVLCWASAYLVAPFAFSLSPSRALQAIVWSVWAIGLGLFVWATLLLHRSHGGWVPRLRSRVLTPQGASYRDPAPLEDSIAAVGDLLTSWVPFSPRVDVILRPSGLLFLRRRLGRTAVSQALVTSKRRIQLEERGALEELLAADAWNRFVPWGKVASVRVPGMLPPHRIRFDFADGTKIVLWTWESKDVQTERALLHVMG